MRRLLGLLLVMGGLAAAVLWAPAQDTEERLTTIAEIANPTAARAGAPTREPAGAAARTFSPQRPLARAHDEPLSAAGPPAESTRRALPRETEYVVTTAANLAPVAPPVRGERLRSVKPADVRARAELVRELQRELRRVGCYSGDPSGNWSPGSKRAMAAFTERVNASLPVEEPDYVLLSLVQAQAGQVCGSMCPPGQASIAGGQCQPRAVLARAGRSPAAGQPDGLATNDTPKRLAAGEREYRSVRSGARDALTARAPEPLPGRMAAGAGRPDVAEPPDPRGASRRDVTARMAASNAGEMSGLAPNSLVVPPEAAKKTSRLGSAHGAPHREKARADRHRRVVVMYRRPLRYLSPFYVRPPGFW